MVENKGKDKVFNWIIYLVMGAYALITLIPLWFVIVNAFSESDAVTNGLVSFLPRLNNGKVGVSIDAFKQILQREDVWRGYRNTILYTVIGVVIQLILQFLAAYPLSRRDMKGRNIVSFYIVLTMFINGGLIPTYIVVRNLGMTGNMWGVIVPGCVGAYNIIIIRTYIQSAISWEYQEAAMVDGCNSFKSFFYIVLPLCKPIIVVMILYGVVGFWNSYFNAKMYVTGKKQWEPLQLVLERLIGQSAYNAGALGQDEADMTETLRYAVIIVSSLPILLIYPFFQKYFEKGLMVGGLKG